MTIVHSTVKDEKWTKEDQSITHKCKHMLKEKSSNNMPRSNFSSWKSTLVADTKIKTYIQEGIGVLECLAKHLRNKKDVTRHDTRAETRKTIYKSSLPHKHDHTGTKAIWACEKGR